jgi:hypothetical protein
MTRMAADKNNRQDLPFVSMRGESRSYPVNSVQSVVKALSRSEAESTIFVVTAVKNAGQFACACNLPICR